MRYTLFGRSGLRVSELCLGTMTFGEDWGWGAPKETCRRVFERFAEAGGNFIDSANNYTSGTAEEILGELLGAERERFVLTTKYTLQTRPGRPERDRQPAQEPRPVARGEPRGGCGPTTSTSTGCTPATRSRRSRRSCARSTTRCAPARCSTSASRTGRPGRSRARRRSRSCAAGRRSPASSCRTPCSSARPSASCCRWRRRSTSPWARSRRSRAGC